MRHRILLGVICLLAIPFLAWREADPGSFNGIPWGSDIGQETGFVVLKEIRDFKICSRKSESHQIDGVEVEEIRYEFYKNKFYSATMKFNGDRNFRSFLDCLSLRYGPPVSRMKYPEEYEWSSHGLNVILRYFQSDKNGSLEYLYKPIFDQITREENCCTP